MTWALLWQPSALRDLARLDPGVRDRVLAKLKTALEDPLRHFLPLRGNRMLWKLRIGDHRLLAYVVVRDRAVEVRAIAHRSVAYR